MRTPLSQKRQVADKMLAYLKEHNITTCHNSYEMLRKISIAIGEPVHELWKGYELLRTMARLELNSSNGKRGFHVLDYNPLSIALPDRPNVPTCDVHHCPILKILKRQFPSITING